MRITDLLSNQGYIIFNKQIANELGLYEAIMIGELASEYNYWSDRDGLEDGWFYSTIENVQQATTLSGHQQRTALKKLEECGILKVQQRGLPAKRYINLDIEKLTFQLLKILTTSDEKNEGLEVENFNGNNNKLKIINNNNNNIYSQVIDYLNKVAGTSYRATSKQTQSHINARVKEGFTIDDFKTVIDNKCSEWKGTEFEQYLRPSTLFGTKFEGYLNAPNRKKGATSYGTEDFDSDFERC